MKTIKCKECKHDVLIENYSLKMNNGKFTRYGKTCDQCRKKKNKIKHSTDEFKIKNRLKQNDYNKRRFFYARAATIINKIKKNKEHLPYTTNELAKFLASLWRKQNGECLLSGDRLTRENAQVDHIITKKNDGSNEFKNLRWITKELNLMKNGLNDDEFFKNIIKLYNKLIVK